MKTKKEKKMSKLNYLEIKQQLIKEKKYKQKN